MEAFDDFKVNQPDTLTTLRRYHKESTAKIESEGGVSAHCSISKANTGDTIQEME